MITVINNDCLGALKAMADCSVDALVTDPPSGINFMGKAWDSNRGGRNAWIAWLREIMAEAFRVLKPGAHGVVWALPRTSHWTTTALEDAGFEIRDVVTHLFGTGYPKSLSVSKSVIKVIEERYGSAQCRCLDEGVGRAAWVDAGLGRGGGAHAVLCLLCGLPDAEALAVLAPLGTALKPASEHWVLVRKPLAGTVAANVLAHGTGALNIDGCRIGTSKCVPGGPRGPQNRIFGTYGAQTGEESGHDPNVGRWPANAVLSHMSREWLTPDPHLSGDVLKTILAYYCGDEAPSGGEPRLEVAPEEVPQGWERYFVLARVEQCERACVEGCPVAMLDEQSGERAVRSKPGSVFRRSQNAANIYNDHTADIGREQVAYGDFGGASRFFYCAKPSAREREAGCEGLPKKSAADLVDRAEDSAGMDSPGAGRTSGGRANHHPTVKSIALMRWLVRLVCPPGGVVLDPFMGSGTTGCAAVLEDMGFIGIDLDAEFVEIAKARIAHWEANQSKPPGSRAVWIA